MVDRGAGSEDEVGIGERAEEVLRSFDKDLPVGLGAAATGGGAVDDDGRLGVVLSEGLDLIRGRKVAGFVGIVPGLGDGDDIEGRGLAGDFGAEIAGSGDEDKRLHDRE